MKQAQESKDFETVRKEYVDARYKELCDMSQYFNKKRGFVKRRVNRGSEYYKSGKVLYEAYSLENWMWFTVTRNDVHFVVSLQPFDRDSKTGNYHVLFDRLGIYAYTGEYSAKAAFSKMLITDISLPLDEPKLEKLEKMLIEISECEMFRIQGQFDKVCKNCKLVNTTNV